MAGQVNVYGPTRAFIAGGAITANRLVKLDSTAGQVVVTSAITDVVVGVALNTAASGGQVEVLVGSGHTQKVCASDAISLGAQVMPTASGSGKCVTAAGATAVSCGIALSASAADGEFIEVQLRPSVKSPANS